jgi:hypothetical protein
MNGMPFNLPGFGMPAWGSQPPMQRVPQPPMQHSFLSALAPAADAFILPVNFAAAAVWGHSGIALQTWGLAPPFSTPQHVPRPSPHMHPHLLMPGMWLPGVVGSSASFIGQQEQGRTSAQRTNKQNEVGELASRLTAFYLKYNPAMLDSVAEVSRNFVGKEQELNDALQRKYKKDLKSMVGASILSAPIDQAQTVSNYLQAFFGELVLDNLWILESFLGSLIEYTLDRKRHSYQNPLSKEQFSPHRL